MLSLCETLMEVLLIIPFDNEQTCELTREFKQVVAPTYLYLLLILIKYTHMKLSGTYGFNTIINLLLCIMPLFFLHYQTCGLLILDTQLWLIRQHLQCDHHLGRLHTFLVLYELLLVFLLSLLNFALF